MRTELHSNTENSFQTNFGEIECGIENANSHWNQYNTDWKYMGYLNHLKDFILHIFIFLLNGTRELFMVGVTRPYLHKWIMLFIVQWRIMLTYFLSLWQEAFIIYCLFLCSLFCFKSRLSLVYVTCTFETKFSLKVAFCINNSCQSSSFKFQFAYSSYFVFVT